MNALFIGRFQPFHLGHLKVVKDIVKNYDIIIAIGSAQESFTIENPFTAGERYEMISDSLKEEKIRNFSIIPIIDINRYAVWVSYVVSLCPRFEIVFSNNELTKMLFSKADYKVSGTKIYDEDKYSGKEVRRRILNGEKWEELVPKKVAELIREFNGINRISALR